MATHIRLARTGAKKRPMYRLVVADKSFPRDGRFLEILGTYDPAKGIEKATYDKVRVDFWISRGALPSETVGQILQRGIPAKVKEVSASS
ncbi:MAG: 30S ribosomal protein S16 [Deltaproteobacteria bacterium]|nr:30S ribosomal protein S16 [Deltaproteobacteria bacterium]